MAPRPPKPVLPPAFTRLWVASGISFVGDGVYIAALPLLAATLTKDPFTLGVVTSMTLLPWLCFGLLGGALVDRWDRRRTMLITDFARAALLAVAALAAAFGYASIPLLIAVAFLLGVGQIFFDNSSSAYLPQLLDRDLDKLRSANARRFGAQNIASNFVGPPLGGVLFALARPIPFLVDAVSFLASGLLIATLPSRPVPAPAQRRSLWAEAWEGTAFVVKNRVLLGFALRFGVGNIAFMAGEAVLVLFAYEVLHLGTTGFGLLLAAQAVGGLGGTVLARRLDLWLGTGRALVVTAGIEAFSLFCLAFSTNAYAAGAALVLCGAAMAATMVIAPSISQAIVPTHLTGRVAATNRLFGFGAAPLGALVGGYLGSVAGLRAPFLFGTVLLVVMTALNAWLAGGRAVAEAIEAARAEQAEQQPAAV